MNGLPGVSGAELELLITGSAGSPVKVSCSVDSEKLPLAPSVTVKVTDELPAKLGIPEMSPVSGSALNPSD